MCYHGGSIGQSRLICQVLCTGIQGISALVVGGPLAKVGSSAKLCVLVCKASLLWYWGGPLAKVGSSAKFCVLVFKVFLLWYWQGPSAKVGSSAKFCVLVFKAFLLWYWGVHQPKKVHLPNLNSHMLGVLITEVFSLCIRPIIKIIIIIITVSECIKCVYSDMGVDLV